MHTYSISTFLPLIQILQAHELELTQLKLEEALNAQIHARLEDDQVRQELERYRKSQIISFYSHHPQHMETVVLGQETHS